MSLGLHSSPKQAPVWFQLTMMFFLGSSLTTNFAAWPSTTPPPRIPTSVAFSATTTYHLDESLGLVPPRMVAPASTFSTTPDFRNTVAVRYFPGAGKVMWQGALSGQELIADWIAAVS
ncbi:hypothetical protein CR513_16143, partial [Mucuna pruriens]